MAGEEIEFKLSQLPKFPSFSNHVYRMDSVDKVTQGASQFYLLADLLEACLTCPGFDDFENRELYQAAKLFDVQVLYRKDNLYENSCRSKIFI